MPRTRSRLEGARVVLAGFRPDAVDAALRLGMRPVALGTKRGRPRGACPRGRFTGDPEEDLATARELLEGEAPQAVVAVTEDAVAPACHLREGFGLPGPGSASAPALTDKAAMKTAVRAAGIPCADCVVVGDPPDPDALMERLGLPLVLKRPTGGGGKGLVIAHEEGQVRAAARPGWVAESFVQGVEMSVETLLVDGAPRFRNYTRYVEPRWINLVPATLSRALARAVDAVADGALAALGLRRGISHLEVFLTPEGPVFGEVAARPPGGRIMDLIRLAYGFDPWEALLAIELGRRPRLPRRRRRFAASGFLHPGAGTVRIVNGVEEARALPGIEDVIVKVDPGDVLTDRVGVSERAVDILAVGAKAEECLHQLGAARRLVRVEIEDEGRAGAQSSGASSPSAASSSSRSRSSATSR